MKNVILRFNSKSSAASIKKALSLSTKMGGIVDGDGMMRVKTGVLAKNFTTLFNEVKAVKRTELSIDGDEILDFEMFSEVVNCNKKRFCKGTCLINWWEWEAVFKAVGILGIKRGEEFCTDDLMFLRVFDNTDILLDDTEKKIVLDRDALISAYTEFYQYPAKYCVKFNEKKILKKLKELSPQIMVEKEVEEERNSSELDELVQLLGDEVEKRLRVVLEEYR